MLVDDQLARIAAAVASVRRPWDANTRNRLSKIFACWRLAREVGARGRAWRARRNRRALTKAVNMWSAWLNKNRGLGAEWTSREAHAEAKRLTSHSEP